MNKSLKQNRINTSDGETIKYLYDSFFPRATLFAVSFVKNESLAKDIVQKVFIKIWDNNLLFDSPTHFKSYLYNSVKNSCLDDIKRKKPLLDDSRDIPQKNIENIIIETEVHAEILKHINMLPKARRQVLLAKIEGMTIEDIAIRYDLSKQTVKNHLSLAKKQLKVSLDNIYPIFLYFFL